MDPGRDPDSDAEYDLDLPAAERLHSSMFRGFERLPIEVSGTAATTS